MKMWVLYWENDEFEHATLGVFSSAEKAKGYAERGLGTENYEPWEEDDDGDWEAVHLEHRKGAKHPYSKSWYRAVSYELDWAGEDD